MQCICRKGRLRSSTVAQRENMTVAILMPVYNEGVRTIETLTSIRSRAADFGQVVVYLVDDGSQPILSQSELPSADDKYRVVFARHAVNLGQGAALETARQLAIAGGHFTAYITMDSDGQHEVEGALAMVRAIENGADVAFGDRFRGKSNVPVTRKLLLRVARLFEWVITGVRLADVHNGLRGFSARAIAGVVLRQNRMAHATEITLRVSHFSIVEVPVAVVYTPDSRAKGQSATGALAIIQDLWTQYLFGELL